MAEIANIQISNNIYSLKDANARNKIEEVENSLVIANKPFNMNKVIFIGDSYAVRSNNWVTPLIQKLGLSSSDYYIGALGSTGFSHMNNNRNFLTLLQSVVSDLSSDEKNSISHVIVCGGANDSLDDYDSIISSITKFSNYVNTNLPNAKLFIGEIGWTSASENIISYAKVVDAYTKCASNKNCFYLNNVQYTLHNYNLIDTDKVHPTYEGANILANNIYQALITGSCNVVYNQLIHQNTIGNLNVFESFNNNNAYVYSNRSRTFFKSVDSIVADGTSGRIILAENLFKYVIGSNYEQNRTCVEAYYNINGTWEKITTNIGVYNGNLILYPFALDNGTARTLTNITQIFLPQFFICMNSLEC